MSKIDPLLTNFYTKVTAEEAPELFKTVSELAHKAGIAVPTIHLKKTGVINLHPLAKYMEVMLDWMIGVLPGGHMIMGTKAMELYGAHNLKAPISPELSAIIAHELGHLKNNDLRLIKLARYSPLAGAAIAMTSLAIFEHYHKKKEEQKPEEKLPGEKGYSHEQEAKDNKHPMGWLLTTAKYLAASAIGIGVGLFTMRAIHHRVEFRADKFSAELMGSGKPLASALKMLGEAIEKESSRINKALREIGLPDSVISGIKKINAFYAKITYPPIEKRIERLGGI